MRVGIDIRVLGSPLKSGVEEYTENLLLHMIPENPNINFKLFFSGKNEVLKKYSWINLENVELVESHFSSRSTFLSSLIFNYPKIDNLLGGVEAFFSPHFILAPLNLNCRRIMTFHDLSYLRFKEFFSLKRNLWHQLQLGSFGKKNLPDKIIAVSNSTRDDIINKYGIESHRVEKIYSGIVRKKEKPTQKELEDFRLKNGLPKKFILFLGKLEPRKNIPALIKAFEYLKNTKDFQDLHLVVVGAKGWLFKNIFKEAEMSFYKNRIMFKDYINDEEKFFYYSLASVFVYASFFEGFGFPPLEAMACGTPVVVSNNSSLPEIVGDSGILVDPCNIADISNGIIAILKDENLRSVLIKRGYEKSKMFDWKKCSDKTLQVILGKY